MKKVAKKVLSKDENLVQMTVRHLAGYLVVTKDGSMVEKKVANSVEMKANDTGCRIREIIKCAIELV